MPCRSSCPPCRGQKQRWSPIYRRKQGARYLLLRGKEKLAEMPERQSRLDALLAINQTLNKVYMLKEDLRQFWGQGSKKAGREFIEQWIAEAKATKIGPLVRFAKTVNARMENILSWYDHGITTGPLQGLNNKIKVLKRVAYGYRDMAFFSLRLLFLHETKQQLTGA